jgi:hypothetical protein
VDGSDQLTTDNCSRRLADSLLDLPTYRLRPIAHRAYCAK